VSADDRLVARRTLIVIGLVLATLVGLALVRATRTVLTWAVVAAFFAVALNPLVDKLQRRLVHSRAAATLIVFLGTFVVLCALGALIVVPLIDDLTRFAERAPELLREARAGRGPLGRLLERFHLLQYAESHAGQLRTYLSRVARPTLGLVQSAAQGVAGVITIVVLAYLMVVEAPRMRVATVALAGSDDAQAERLRRIGRECSRAVTGYLSGNLLISVIAGLGTFLVLVLTGVPFAAVIALLVAIADLIPLVGATLGGVVAVGAALLHSPTAGIIVLVFYVVYQQIEDHLLQPVIMYRTVRLNPLTVLVALLIGAELAGLVGALLAIPVASIVQVLLHELVPASRRAGGRANNEPGAPAQAGGADQPAGDHQGQGFAARLPRWLRRRTGRGG
jgi:predicted PurR-regulated permease PerM